MGFSGMIYWRPSDWLVQCWDSRSGLIRTLTTGDPRLPPEAAQTPDGGSSNDFGTLIRLGSGNFLVGIRYGSQAAAQVGFVVSPLLDPTGEVWAHDFNHYWQFYGYTGYEEASGVYDPKTKLNWLARAIPGTPWEWNGFDEDGNWVEGRGDTSWITHMGDAYIGGNLNYPINASMLGRWLYRFAPEGDALIRYNLDTDAWQAILPQWQHFNADGTPDRFAGFCCEFSGVDNREGTIVTIRTSNRNQAGYDGKEGWVEVRDPDADPWVNPVPDGIPLSTQALGPPLRMYDPTGPGGPADAATWTGSGTGSTVVLDGKIYYSSYNDWNIDYGYDADGKPFGYTTSFYAMTLANGQIEKVFDVPFLPYDANGQELANANDPAYYIDNNTQRLLGMNVIRYSIDGGPVSNRRAFKGTIR